MEGWADSQTRSAWHTAPHTATPRASSIHTLRRCACVPQPHACTGLCKQLNIHVECPQVRERAATMPKDDAGRGSTVRHVWRERALLRALCPVCPELGSSCCGRVRGRSAACGHSSRPT